VLQCSNKPCKKSVNERALWTGWLMLIDTSDPEKVKNDYYQFCGDECLAEHWTRKVRAVSPNWHLGDE
jgi:hypothetical protein